MMLPRIGDRPTAAVSRGVVATAVQDRTGFLWLATGDGLMRFDNYCLGPVGREHPIPSDETWARSGPLLAGSDGRVWIGRSQAVQHQGAAQELLASQAPLDGRLRIVQPAQRPVQIVGTALPHAPSDPVVVGGGQRVNQVDWTLYVDDGIGPDTFDLTWGIEEFNAGPGPVWVGSGEYMGAVVDARLGGYDFSVICT